MDSISFQANLVPRTKDEPSIMKGGVLKIRPTSLQTAEMMAPFLKAFAGGVVTVKIEDGTKWSNRMNRLFHALVKKAMQSGQCSYWDKMGRAPETFEEVKTWIKVDLCGAEVKQVGEMVWVESWTNFNKSRAIQSIDSVLKWMSEVGVSADLEYAELNELRR